ncbi:DUF6471 domain-containing protein [Paraburkholderia phenoliruptrix]|uniref:DUF6471 domain-containing protein n=1 Tax=Paraburkholderia phenoliruptrix TaxID=252970 RepID=UPI0028698E22|nr:DUF6471 domain-containing protein [Paraburkholderia phenoliruptrix]WMY11754.1 DUF6471 domain-containing protein [Paraburkholderia phenoliruptrix]
MKSNENIDAVWSRLVSRATRVALMRQDTGYAQLAEALKELGVSESPRSIEGKIQRGTFRFSFFLQAAVAANTDIPRVWKDALHSAESWERRAAAVLEAELAQQPWVRYDRLAARLDEIGIVIPAAALEAQICDGSFPASLFFQCATVCRFESVERFVDSSSLQEAALRGAGQAPL